MTIHTPSETAANLYQVGLAALLDKRYKDAAQSFLGVVQNEPLDSDSWCKFAQSLWGAGDRDYALAIAKEAVKLDPSSVEANAVFGGFLQGRGLHAESIPYLEKSLGMAIDQPHSHWNLAHALLALTNLIDGMSHYRYGFIAQARKLRTLLPGYTGKEGSVFIWSEQGGGDQLFFSRFAIDFARVHPCQIAFEVYRPYYRLLRSQKFEHRGLGHLDVVCCPEDWSMPWGSECHLPAMEVPCWLRPYDEPATPWLVAPGLRKFVTKGKAVGIVWKGAASFEGDKERSISIEQFEPIVRAIQDAGYQVVSLQLPLEKEEVELLEKWGVEDWGQMFVDWADTADALAVLDHVVTVSTGISVLAGAMGVPTKCLIPDPADWRWYTYGRKAESAFWFPHSRLFWQREKGVWQGAIDDLVKSYNDADFIDSVAPGGGCYCGTDERGVHSDGDSISGQQCLHHQPDSGGGPSRQEADSP